MHRALIGRHIRLPYDHEKTSIESSVAFVVVYVFDFFLIEFCSFLIHSGCWIFIDFALGTNRKNNKKKTETFIIANCAVTYSLVTL